MQASVALACSISQPAVELALEGVVSRGVGEGLISAQGQITVKAPVLEKGTVTVPIARELITQYWLSGPDLKLRIYWETPGSPHETLDLEITARRSGGADGIDYPGRFTGLMTSMAGVTGSEAKTSKIKGRVDCQVD